MADLAVGRPMEILLVEDSLIDARITMEALAESGLKHRLTLVRDGEECLEFLQQSGRFSRAPRPDLILLDLNLPKRDGITLLQDIQENQNLRGVPVVVLTASDSGDTRSQCEKMNVQAYLPKPVNIDGFLKIIQLLRRDWLHHVLTPNDPQ